MSRKEEYKITVEYPEWISIEGWINEGHCDADLPRHEKLQLKGKHGHMKTIWICTAQV